MNFRKVGIAALFVFFVMLGMLFIGFFAVSASIYRFPQTSRFHGGKSDRYKIVKFNHVSKKKEIAFTRKPTNLGPYGFVSFVDEIGNEQIITKAESREYICGGKCYCEDEEFSKRRVSSIAKPMNFIVAAVSLTLAVSVAKNYFEDVCNNQFENHCESTIYSNVDECFFLENTVSDDLVEDTFQPKKGEEFYCTGNCMDQIDYFQKNWEFENGDGPHYNPSGEYENELFPKHHSELEEWMEQNAEGSDGVWIYWYKKHTGFAIASYDRMIDICLRYGWIDGQYQKVDEDIARMRFAKRGDKSKWSQTNLKKARKLTRDGRMTPAGKERYEHWLSMHPDDSDSYCNVLEHQSTVVSTGRTEIITQFKKELDALCKSHMKTNLKMKGGNGLFLKCYGHEKFYNPTVKCQKSTPVE